MSPHRRYRHTDPRHWAVRLRSETASTTTLLDAATGTVTREWTA